MSRGARLSRSYRVTRRVGVSIWGTDPPHDLDQSLHEASPAVVKLPFKRLPEFFDNR